MPLGLEDLKKKRTTSTPVKKAAGRTNYPAGAWSAREEANRPWDDDLLEDGKAPAKSRHRQSPIATDAVMNEDWIRAHAASIFWTELTHDTLRLRVREEIAKLEVTVQTFFVNAKTRLRRFGLPV